MRTKRKHTGRNILLIVLAIIIAGIAFWQFYKYKLINGKVKDAVYAGSHGLYSIQYDHIEVDEVAGNLHVTNLQLIPDTAMFGRMARDHQNPPLLLHITIPDLRITGVKTPKALLNKKIEGRRVDIKNPLIELYYAKNPADTFTHQNSKELYEQVLGNLSLIKADTIEVTNGTLSFMNLHNNKKIVGGYNISLHLLDVLVDSLHKNDASRFFFSKQVTIACDSIIFNNKDSVYAYTLKGIDFNSVQKHFSIHQFRLTPLLGENEFMVFSKIQKDRYNFSLSDMDIRHIDLEKLMAGALFADTLFIKESSFKIYRDLSYPHDSISRMGAFPQQALIKLALPIDIQKAIVAHSFIEYKERNARSKESGKVQFYNVHTTIANITNVDSLIAKNNNCVLNFNARLLNMAGIRALLTMKLQDPQGRFTISGTLNGFDAPRLNVLLKPMALAQIDKGAINKLDFDLACDNHSGNGRVLLLYDNLKLSLLKKVKDEDALKKKQLVSLVANAIITNSNPAPKKSIRYADVHYQRDMYKSFFNLIWKSIFAGLKQSVGM